MLNSSLRSHLPALEATPLHMTPGALTGPRTMTPSGRLHSPLRFSVAALAVITAAAHVPVTAAHLHEAPYIGALFLLLEIIGITLAILILHCDRPHLYKAAAAVGLVAILGYIASRSVGLPQIQDDVGNWTEPLGIEAIIAETSLVITSCLAQSGRIARSVRPVKGALAGLCLLLLGLGTTILVNGNEQPDSTAAVHIGSSPRATVKHNHLTLHEGLPLQAPLYITAETKINVLSPL